MTLKNFLKTAVLGIAFCSVFGINKLMAVSVHASPDMENPNIELQNILNELAIYHHDVLHDDFIYFNKSISCDLSKQAQEKDEIVRNKILEIIYIIQKTLENDVDEQDIHTVNQNIDDICQLTNTYYSTHAFDINNLRANKNNIINAINNRL